MREAITSTFNMIKRDVMQAALASSTWKWAEKARSSMTLLLYDKDDTTQPSTPFYKEIYMSYGGFSDAAEHVSNYGSDESAAPAQQ